MLREIIEKINEGSTREYYVEMKQGVSFEDVLDWLDDHGGYESIEQYAKHEFGIKSTYEESTGESRFILSDKDYKKFREAIKDIFELVEIKDNIDFEKINSKAAFKKLSAKGKLAVIYHWLSGNTDIQPSNIDDLVVNVTSKRAVFTSNTSTVDVGKDTISGMEELPFGLKISDLKKIIKEIK